MVSPLFLQLELVLVKEMNCHLQELSANPHYVIVISAPMCLPVLTHNGALCSHRQKNPHTAHTQQLTMAPIPKRRKKSPPLILAAPTPVPGPLIAAAKVPEAVAAKAPEAAVAKVAATHRAHPAWLTHPEGIVIEIVGITACN